MATTVDSATVPVQDTTVVAVPQTDSLDNGNVFHYVTHDGKTEFTLTHEPEDGKVIVKNEADGTTYNMKQTVSGSGEKYIDDNEYYFIGHQGEFYFGKDGKDIVTGKRK